MKRALLIIFAAAGVLSMAAAQGRTVDVSLTNEKGKPVKGLEVYPYIKGDNEVSILEPGGNVIMQGIEQGDVIAVLIGDTIYEIPTDGADSVRIVMKNKNKITGYSINGNEIITRDMRSYPVETEELVKGAVDIASSYAYRDLREYIESRMRSITPVTTNQGLQLVIRGNGGGPALIVADGITYTNFDMVNAFIKPWQVKSIEVDRIGALYGDRGKYGVITITTRRE